MPEYLQREIKLLIRGGYKRTVIFWENKVTRKNTTGYTLFIEFTKGGKVIGTLSEESGNIIHTAAQGQFNVQLTDAEVLAYEHATMDYRMWVDYGDDFPQVLEKGTVRIE